MFYPAVHLFSQCNSLVSHLLNDPLLYGDGCPHLQPCPGVPVVLLHLAAHSDNDGGTSGDQMHFNCKEELAAFIIASIPLNIYCKFQPAARPAEMEIKHSHSRLMKEEGAFKHQYVQLLNETALFRQQTVPAQSLVLSSAETNFVVSSIASLSSPEKHKLKKLSNKAHCISSP